MTGTQKGQESEEPKVSKDIKALYLNTKNSEAESEAIGNLNNLAREKKCFGQKSLAIYILNKYTPLETKLARKENETLKKQAS